MAENVDANMRPKTSPSLQTPSKGFQLLMQKTPKSRPQTTLSTPSTTPFSPASINSVGSQAREAARISKIQNTAEKIRKVAELKSKWAEDKERKIILNQEKREREMKRLQEINSTAAERRKKSIETHQAFEKSQQEVLRDQLATSLEARAQLAIDLEKEKRERRRRSVLINAEIKKKAKEREDKMLIDKKEEDLSLLESRRLDALALKEAQRQEFENRRQSLIGRGEACLKQREINEKLEQEAMELEKSLIQFRYDSWKDEREGKEMDAARKRESLAGRLDTWRQERETVKSFEEAEKEQTCENFTARYDDWLAMQTYKAEMEKTKRVSLACRLDKWREEKTLEAKQREEEQEATEYEHDLYQQALADMRRYEESLQRSRRASLAFRLEKAKEDKTFEEGQKAVREALEKEDRELSELAREDVERYQESLRCLARQSLSYRQEIEKNEKIRLAGVREQEMIEQKEDFEMSSEAWRDVKTYQEEQRALARKSLAGRLVEASRQHHIDLTMHRQALDVMHEDFELKRNAWKDVNSAKEGDRERSRRSIAFRLESWRQERMAEEMLNAKKALIAEEDARYREMDRQALQMAKAEHKLALKADHAKGGFVV